MTSTKKLKTFGLAVVAGVFVTTFVLYTRPIPKPLPMNAQEIVAPKEEVKLAWPGYGQAAVGAVGYGVLDTDKPQLPVPIASTAKVITALTVLKQKPLSPGQQGPVITLTAEDRALFEKYYSQGGSVTKVAAGEKITQYQALQSLLLPSSNNMADSLARWAFGSLESYIAVANEYVKSLGMEQTKVADASGFSDATVGSARDLVILAQEALANPVLSDIVAQTHAKVPVAGLIHNSNNLLNRDGIIGIKTGHTDAAGGCYLFGAKRVIDGQTITVVGAVVAAPSVVAAMSDSLPLIRSMDSGFKTIQVAAKGQKTGYYKLPWDGNTTTVAGKSVSMLVWRGNPQKTTFRLDSQQPGAIKGKNTGEITFVSGRQTAEVPIVLNEQMKSPSWTWRLFR